MSSNKSIVVDCGASHVAYSVYQIKAGNLVLEEFYNESLQFDYSDDDGWLAALRDRLKSILSQAKTKGEATIIAPGYQLLTKTIKVPHVERQKQSQIIAFEAQQNIPYPLSEVVWGHQILSDDGIEAEVLLIAFKSQVAIQFCQTLSSLGLKPISVQPASIMDYNAFQYAYGGSEETVLLLNIGARSTNMLFISPEGFFARNIALGGNSLTQNTADQLGRSFLQAEQTKVALFNGEVEYDENDSDQAILWQAVNAFTKRMGQEITRSIVNYKRQRKGQAPSYILLNGKGSLLPGLAEQLSESQQVVVDYFDPTQSMSVGSHLSQDYFTENYFQISESLGCACKPLLGSISVGINLLPPSIAREMSFKRKKVFIAAASLILPLSPLPALMQYSGVDDQYDNARKALKESYPAFEERHQQILDLQNESRELSEKIKKLETFVNTRYNWINFFADLQKRLVEVEDAWFDKLDVTREKIESSGSKSSENQSELDALIQPQNIEYKLNIEGKMLLRASGTNELTLDKQVASKRVRKLINGITESEFIKEVEGQPSFDTSNPRVLKFNFTLVVNNKKPL